MQRTEVEKHAFLRYQYIVMDNAMSDGTWWTESSEFREPEISSEDVLTKPKGQEA